MGTAVVSDGGDEVVTRGRCLLFEVSDPLTRSESEAPLGPSLPTAGPAAGPASGLASGPASGPAAKKARAASAAHPSASLSSSHGGGQGSGVGGESGEEDAGCGPRERALLRATGPALRRSDRWLRCACAKQLEGAVLQVPTSANMMAARKEGRKKEGKKDFKKSGVYYSYRSICWYDLYASGHHGAVIARWRR